MKRLSAWITLPLTAGVAFGVAWWWRPPGTEPAHTAAAARVVNTSNATPGEKSNHDTTARVSSPLYDARLREALDMPDLAAAIRHILQHEREDYCADARLRTLVELLPASRLGELHAALHTYAGNDFIVRSMIGAWAERDAAEAQAWVQAHPSLSRNALAAFTSGFFRAVPDDALAWVDSQPLSAATGALRTAVIETMAEKNPAAAFDFIKSRGWLSSGPAVFARLMQNWGHADPDGALAGLRQVTRELGLRPSAAPPDAEGKPGPPNADGESFAMLLRSLLNGVCQRDPAQAAALFSRLTADELSAGYLSFGEEVLTRDPAFAAAIFESPEDTVKKPILRDLAERFPAANNFNRMADPARRSPP